MTTTYFKVLNLDGMPCHGGTGRWSLPDGDEPGAWMQRIYSLVQCKRGYHLCRGIRGLLSRLGPAIYLAEVNGAVLVYDDEVVAETARLLRQLPWDECTARLFAADCTERVLPIFEREWPADVRPRTAVEVARRYATGEASDTELRDTHAAAWDAAWDAADAADAAAWAVADAADAAANAAAAAVGAAANATRTAADAAAWISERDWQATQLAHYLGLEMQP